MVVGIKDSVKLVGIGIIACCAVLVCTLFVNFYIDIRAVEGEITAGPAMIFYEAQVSTVKVVCSVAGGVLLLTSVIMLLFFVKHYIDTHKKELGILKALGYSDLKVAGHFWVFGIIVLIGSGLGFAGAFLLMPRFYELQNEEGLLPEITVRFHPSVLFYFVILPTLGFALLAILYALHKLKSPVLTLLRDSLQTFFQGQRAEGGEEEKSSRPFLEDLKRNTLRSKKVLIFFILFASFCFSAMTQMSFSMKDLSSEMMGMMMLLIGLVLAFTTLFLAVTTVINGNRKTIAMMRVFGYSQQECSRAILGVYRPYGYLGFALGTVYQYALLRMMVDMVFRDYEGIPDYSFDFPMMFFSLGVFIVAYEAVMYAYSERIKRISVKEIMLE